MKVNAGNDWQAAVMGNAAASGAGTGASRAADYIALTESATAPAAADTTLSGELTAFGLGRAQATYAHTTAAATYTLSKAFTSSDATTRTINKIGVFNASSAGTLVFETLVPTPPSMLSGDVVTITETVNL